MAKTVIITGATSGYGLAAAKKFKENGDRVIIASRNAEKVAKAVMEYGFDDGYTLDVTSYGNWVSFKEKVTAKYGKIDVLVNNAGFGVYGDFCSSDLERELELIDTNIKALHILTKCAVKKFKEKNKGYIHRHRLRCRECGPPPSNIFQYSEL